LALEDETSNEEPTMSVIELLAIATLSSGMTAHRIEPSAAPLEIAIAARATAMEAATLRKTEAAVAERLRVQEIRWSDAAKAQRPASAAAT
jgi:hypothetical protein